MTVVALSATAVVLLPSPTPVAADAARPGNTRSQVDDIAPAVQGVAFDIVGGDAFLRARVQPGHELLVPGYGGEPYLRVLVDGTVEENRRSPAVVLNRDRYGATTEPLPDVTDAADPEWHAVGGGGEVLWHDHRVHWMARVAPPTISADGLIQPWTVPVEVDGVAVVVRGSLYRVDGPGALWWLAVLPAAGLALWLLSVRKAWLGVAASVTGLGVAVVHGSGWVGLPPEARSFPAAAALGGLALVLGAIAAARPWRVGAAGAIALAGAGTSLVLAGWAARAYVSAGVLPVDGAAWPYRAVVPVALGLGVVALGSGAWRVLRVSPVPQAAVQKNEPQNGERP